MLRAVVVALALALVACKGKAKETPAPASGATASGAAASDAAPDQWNQPRPDATPDTPEARSKRAAEALSRVAAIKPVLATLRGLSFDREVPTEYQSAADFQAFVHREIAKELPPAKTADLSAAFLHIGLFQKAVDLAQVEEQAVTTQAGAYYDPEAKKFFLVMVPDSELMLDTISAHELTHALQDQHFDLGTYLPSGGDGKPELDDDAASARRFVVEGDATFAMLLYAIANSSGQSTLSPTMLKLLHGQIENFAGMDLQALKDMTRDQAAAFSSMDSEIKASVDAMDDIPSAVLVPMLDSYMKGALVAFTAYEHGGWKDVNALFTKPPESTEQVLHPATKLYPTRDRPHHVTLATLVGYDEIAANVMGELQWSIYFSLWTPSAAAQASEGWGGDRYSVARRKDGRLIARFATTWDSAADATQFASAYAASLLTRFPGATPDADGAVARPDGGKVFVKVAGAKVYIVDGADDAAMLADLVRTAKLD